MDNIYVTKLKTNNMSYIKNYKEYENDCEIYTEELVDMYEYLTTEEQTELQRWESDQEIGVNYKWDNSKIIPIN